MATFDYSKEVLPTKQQSSRRVEWLLIYDFALFPLVAGESAKLFDIPAGFVYEKVHQRSITPEGVASTFDLGVDADSDAFSDGANANLAAGSNIPIGGAPAYTDGQTFLVNTPAVIACPGGAATLNDGKIAVTYIGYMTDIAAG